MSLVSNKWKVKVQPPGGSIQEVEISARTVLEARQIAERQYGKVYDAKLIQKDYIPSNSGVNSQSSAHSSEIEPAAAVSIAVVFSVIVVLFMVFYYFQHGTLDYVSPASHKDDSKPVKHYSPNYNIGN